MTALSLPPDLLLVLVEHCRDAVVITQQDRVVFVNAAAVRLSGARERSELIGRPASAFLVTEDAPLVQQRTEAREAGELFSQVSQVRVRRPDGELLTVECSSVAVEYHGGPATMAIVRDVTEKLRLEQERERQLAYVAVTLAEIGAASDLESALSALGRGAISLLRGHGGAVRLFPRHGVAGTEGRHIAYEVSEAGVLSLSPYQEPLPDSVPQALLEGGEGRYFDDLYADAPPDTPLGRQRRERGMRSSVAVPLLADGVPTGSLHVDHREVGFFGPADVAMAQALAAQASGAIMRLRLDVERQVAAAERARLDGALLVARTAAHQLNNALAPVVGFAELLGLMPEVKGNATAAAYAKLIGDAATEAASLVQRLQRIVRIEHAESPLGPDKPILDLDRSAAD